MLAFMLLSGLLLLGIGPVGFDGIVAVKLLLVDLANSGGGERIVAFIGVGLLMVAVGYFAPLPPADGGKREP